ncbi:hypothetical protein KGO95_01305 [Patescibacteria group bacterium]|nr:hypothetical protein [Patescibacteria group bacterium]
MSILRPVALGPKRVLWCQPCGVPLQIGNNRLRYCPLCKASERDESVKSILHCAECDNPLQFMLDGGSWCKYCNFTPSLQDTYLLDIRKMKSPA